MKKTEGKKVVLITEVKSESLEKKLDEILRKVGFKAKGKVLVKPNMCMPGYVPGAVTSPKVIYYIVRLLRKTSEEVIVGESDGYNYSCDLAFEKTGIKDAAEKAGGKTINLSRDKLVQVSFKDKEFKIKRLFLPKTLFEVDSVVNVPIMKTHEFTVYSGALKNLFGLIPDRKRIFLHPHLNEVLFTLYELTKPMTVMDALTAMEKNGPTRGTPVEMNLVLASKCPLALDVVATEIMGLDWEKISHLSYIAQKTKFDRQNVKVVGDSARYSRKFATPVVDLPVEMQLKIYQHALLTKMFFSNPNFVKILQKFVSLYRSLRGST
ncbi:MAG: DUF362 domain-containing protein [Candidatus Bathyarchaeota archaeon]|nr:DUF362 domain-containing protein [Candidatus Bathyarchaeota archaeon]MDW8040605.1 DUF362 domain-containing protein [Nitrososphaerota archaeon]